MFHILTKAQSVQLVLISQSLLWTRQRLLENYDTVALVIEVGKTEGSSGLIVRLLVW